MSGEPPGAAAHRVAERAHAKVNLVLRVGPLRSDGLHELASVFASLSLHDEVVVESSESGGDDIVCRGVEGPNLAQAALERFRARSGAALGPLRVGILKRIPVAAGLGGGSADAAAVLRAANALAGRALSTDALRAIGAELGSDVPSQVDPRHALVSGAGERVEALRLPAMSIVLVPQAHGLSTAEVYAMADRLGSTRARVDPGDLRSLAAGRLEELVPRLENDLEAAALALRPDLALVRERLLAAGALAAQVTGSGPTVFGVFATQEAARKAARGMPGAVATGLRDPDGP